MLHTTELFLLNTMLLSVIFLENVSVISIKESVIFEYSKRNKNAKVTRINISQRRFILFRTPFFHNADNIRIQESFDVTIAKMLRFLIVFHEYIFRGLAILFPLSHIITLNLR